MQNVFFCFFLLFLPMSMKAQIVHDENELMQIRDQLEEKRKNSDSFEDAMRRRDEELKERRIKIGEALKKELTASPAEGTESTELNRDKAELQVGRETSAEYSSGTSDEDKETYSGGLPVMFILVFLIILFIFKYRRLNLGHKKSKIRQLEIE